MLLKGLNDSTRELNAIAVALDKIGPDEVHITLPTRPPAESWVEPADTLGIQRALSIIGGVAKVFPPVEVIVLPRVDGDVIDAVHRIVSRHPLRETELIRLLSRWVPGRIFATLADLTEKGQTQVVVRNGVRFWCDADAKFPS